MAITITITIAPTTSMPVASKSVNITSKSVCILPAPAQPSVVLVMAVVTERARNDREVLFLVKHESGSVSLLVGARF